MLAMVLANARSEVETYAGQPVKDVVIAVPAHFGPGERQAVETAARIAGLNPLQLLSAGAAAALNYGVFRYKDITQEPQVWRRF
jgi:molecular chaperone DnaK (HSP70)